MKMAGKHIAGGTVAIRIAAATIAALLMTEVSPASAEDAYPDIVGTWVGQDDEVRIGPGMSSAAFGSEPVTQIITEQKDRRFAGTMMSGKGPEQFHVAYVGIFIDSDHFRWSEPGGFVEGRMIDADTIESCYVRTAEDSHVAACQTLTRQK
jgi:hypothetical protein